MSRNTKYEMVDKLMFLPGRLRKTDIILTYQQIHDEFIKLMPADWGCTSEYHTFMDYLSGNYVHEYAITESAVDFVLDRGKQLRPDLYERAFLLIAAAIDVLARTFKDEPKEISRPLYEDAVRMITEILDRPP